MNEYRDKLMIQNRIIAVCAFILASFGFFAAANEAGIIDVMPATGDSHWASSWNGIIFGIACSLLGFLIGWLVRNIRALRNEEILKKLYIKDNDERQILIWTNARAVAMQTFLIVGLMAGVIAGFFNMVVSITIFACLFIHSMIGLAFVFYFNLKM